MQARSHLVLSSVFESIGDVASALDHAVRALELLSSEPDARERGVFLLRLADASALVGAEDEARRRYAEAEALFAEIGDEEQQLLVLNNRAVLEYEGGHWDAALVAANRLAQLCGPQGLDPSYADTIARAWLSAGKLADAEEMVRHGFELLTGKGDSQAVTPAELALTHVEILRAGNRLDEAADQLARCLQVCEERDLRGMRVHALRAKAELHAAQGDHAAAYLAHRAFHDEFVAVRSLHQEAAARTRQALAGTAEARADAQRFWQQARTDPLTNVFNRRFVDEELPRYLRRLPTGSGRLGAAIVDVDHFKKINDTFSHAVGDQVLERLGQLLAAAAATPMPTPMCTPLDGVQAGDTAPAWHRGFAARLGGEEFLLVLEADTAVDLVAILERLRSQVQGHDWADLDPRLTVTVSIGVAVAGAADTQTSLLARADEHLYRAKERGRNRVVADPLTGRPDQGCHVAVGLADSET